MLDLLPELRAHFDPLESRLRVFSRYGFQAESWLKGEMVAFLDAALMRGRISHFDREVKIPSGKRVDLVVESDGRRHWVELKHWLIGEQRGQVWRSGFYFVDKSSFGLMRDLEKLGTIPGPDSFWMVVLATANPGKSEWEEGLAKFHTKFAPVRVTSHSDPDQFPECYLLGLFELEK
jgi:hypothetical protein